MTLFQRGLLIVCASLLMAACAQAPTPYNYTMFRQENPKTILVVPAVNNTVDVNAPDSYLSTISVPLAERGYYVFPVNLVKKVMENDGLADANMVHAADPKRLGEIFGTDSILYVSINKWDAKYIVISTSVEVSFTYTLKSGRTGETLWTRDMAMTYSPQASGGGLGGLIAQAIVSAIEKADPSYIPLTQQANAMAVNVEKIGLPAGPYDAEYGKDHSKF
ncbi:DUF799 domain-containing protein [Govanella unica]|uniref:DUF799 domain-containing protein n=1 Tax=Govanella unica TaxID=2975056 RepID=A0A9X3TWZ8_9PROT|nr:GNA1162 family protein [Govania unica]MDA5193303.1 DUF799 domain-containing protein [Govania unica]